MSSVVGLKSLINQAWDWLMNSSSGKIAICGRGGIGKTTLMRQLYKKLLRTQNFENLIWVNVSSNSTPAKIQEAISKSIGLFNAQWVWSSPINKAQLIHSELSGKKFVLFLDDLWSKVDLSKLGVPSSVLKLIFTTRSETLATEMFADSILEMHVFSEEDSWQLFSSRVGHDVLTDPNISELAAILVRKCEGLPICLCTVGCAMASRKTNEEWLDALVMIRRLEGTDTTVNSLLQFCFDSLSSHRIKSCLIYFSLFPEDFAIPKNSLIDFWICEHLLDECDTGDDTLELGYNGIDTLLGAGLLEKEEDDDCVKLLDMIRDFASSVAFNCQMFKNAQLLETARRYLADHVGWFSTMDKLGYSISTASVTLEIFLRHHNPFAMMKGKPLKNKNLEHSFMADHYQEIPSPTKSEISQALNLLTVLDLSYSGIEEVPQELSELASLQYLNLSHTWIYGLPIELRKLTKLKCLNLEYDDQLRIIPVQLISSLTSLQVLKLFRCGYSVEELRDNILSLRNMDIDPLLCLEKLKVLSITITCIYALHQLFNNPKFFNCTQSLSLEVLWGSRWLDISPLACMKNLLTLEIHQAEVLEELNFNLQYPRLQGERSFKRLREVTLSQCSNLRELTWVILAPNLVVFRAKDCEKMEEIINIQLSEILENGEDLEPFPKLEILALESLPKLKSIYGKVLPFQHLKKVKIIDCLVLKRLPLNSDSTDSNNLVIEADEDWWKDVEWEDDATKTTFVPCFRQSLFI